FDGPATVHEAVGQPVEQLRVRWWLAEGAEVVRRPYQALAEVPAPQPIDHDAACEWVVATDQPLRQLEPAASLAVKRRRLGTGQHVWHVARHHPAQVLMPAAGEAC